MSNQLAVPSFSETIVNDLTRHNAKLINEKMKLTYELNSIKQLLWGVVQGDKFSIEEANARYLQEKMLCKGDVWTMEVLTPASRPLVLGPEWYISNKPSFAGTYTTNTSGFLLNGSSGIK